MLLRVKWLYLAPFGPKLMQHVKIHGVLSRYSMSLPLMMEPIKYYH